MKVCTMQIIPKFVFNLCVIVAFVAIAWPTLAQVASDSHLEDAKEALAGASGGKDDMSKMSEADDLEPPAISSTAKPSDQRKANYSEPRFAQLFNARNRPRARIPVKYTTRAKPTLPPFIRNPPHLRATTDEPSTTKAPRTTKGPTAKSVVRTTTASSRSRLRTANQVSTESPTRKPNRKFGDPPVNPRNSTRTRTRNNN